MFLKHLKNSENSLPIENTNAEDLDYVSSARAAVLEQSPKGAQRLLWVILIFFTCFLLWAANTEVDEFTRGEGKVIPSQKIQIVQNLEGGILAEIFVNEGDIVERGQNLVRLDDTQFSSSLNEAGVTLAQLQLKSQRLGAEASGQPFKIENEKDWPVSLIRQERAFYQSRQHELDSNKSLLKQKISQKEQELSEIQAKRRQLQVSYDLLNKEVKLTRPLVAEGAVSEVEFLRLERQLNDLKGQLDGAALAEPRIRSTLDEEQEKLNNLELVFKREAQEQLNNITLELSRLKETSEALADRVKRTTVKSPVTGTVKRLLVNTIGGVVQPGMDIAELVPSEEVLLIEARIRPADIAYLHPDQTAKIKFTAYDFAVMGGLDGKLIHISPDTITDEKNESFYQVRVETSRVFRAPDGTELPIIPGMTVSVDVLTGKKTILDYLLKPILKTKQLALRER